jgi:hypothetical protein
MAINPSNTSWGSDTKNINYIGKDFATFKQNLIDFTKTYFPNTYSDFNEASPGMVFIEQAAAIGDVLSFYQDTQLKESMLSHATERKNVVSLAQSMGYKPKVTSPAITTLTVYQLIPSVYNAQNNSGTNYEADSRFYFKIKAGFEVQSSTNSNVSFITTDAIDFANPTDRTIEVYERDAITGTPTQYLVSKKIKAISARENTTGITLGSDTDYPTIQLSETNIIQIVSIADSNNNKYYEVPYLAQESIFVEQPNVNELSYYSGSVPYILEVQKVPRRFSVKINSDNTTEIQFGSGDVNLRDEQILPNTKNIGLGLANSINRLNQGIDPSNFLKTNTFGIAPAGQVLTIKYLTGGGIASNVNVGDLTKIQKIEFDDDLLAIPTGIVGMYNSFKSSIAVENLEPAIGGRGAESIEEIRQNALATFGSQNRAVTKQDYIVRALSLPERYGSVAKVYVSQDGEIDNNSPASILSSPASIAEFTNLVDGFKGMSKSDIQGELIKYLSTKKSSLNEVNNPFAINMYVLGYDVNKHLTPINQAVKQNLKTYLGEYRMITDAVNMIDGFVVNIGVDFDVICYSNYNKREVVTNCLVKVQDYFNIDNWTFNKPINISELELILANVEGVMSVPSVKISNLCGGDGNYSPNKYNIDEATRGKIVYPSLDPCIFEVKYPNKDIKGRAL